MAWEVPARLSRRAVSDLTDRLIAPGGGSLVDLEVDGTELEEFRAGDYDRFNNSPLWGREFVGTGEDRYIGGVAENYKFPIDPAAAKKRTYEIYLELVPSRLNAFPGAVELVGACQNAGLKVAVASSADRIKIDANLRKIGLPPGTWDAIVTAEDVARKKPAPDIFLAAGQKLGLTPEQCAVVEDSVNGVQAAKAAGMRCVAVAQTFPPEQLQTADLVKGRISDVTVAELTGELKSVAPGGPSPLAAVASPQPWGFWVTVGFALAIWFCVLVFRSSSST